MHLRKVCPQCNIVVHMKRSVCDCRHSFASKKRKAWCTAVGEPENAMKRLLSEVELLVTKERDKVCKASETHKQSLHRQEQNQTHLACTEGSALQCCSLHKQVHDKRGIAESLQAYITRARLTELRVRWVYFQEKYHNSRKYAHPPL